MFQLKNKTIHIEYFLIKDRTIKNEKIESERFLE